MVRFQVEITNSEKLEFEVSNEEEDLVLKEEKTFGSGKHG